MKKMNRITALVVAGIISCTSPMMVMASDSGSVMSQAEEILKKADYMKPPCLMKQESSLILTAARDIFSSDVEEFVVNKKEDCENLLKLLPERKNEIKLYEGNVPVFENYFMESKLEKLFSKKVWLKSGGFLIIEQTEACVVIDVNTGDRKSVV